VIGLVYRLGTLSTWATMDTLDHDVPRLAEGVMMLHGASITASATFGHSASPCNVTCWYIMALPCALKIYVKYSDNFLPPELIAFQSLTNVFLFQ
jgi:hypothetical protein